MKAKPIVMALASLLMATSCSGQSKPKETETKAKQETMEKKGKALVVFFSHAGENYNVGNIEVGNTKIVADYISELTGADQFEVVAKKSYDMPYMKLIEVAKEETRRGELPEYLDSIDVAPYDTVFIGGPIWWGTYPQVMFTLFRDINLDGKTIIPFTTHEGSGLASTVSDVKKSFPKANVQKGWSIYGHEVRSGRAKVEKWLNGLGY